MMRLHSVFLCVKMAKKQQQGLKYTQSQVQNTDRIFCTDNSKTIRYRIACYKKKNSTWFVNGLVGIGTRSIFRLSGAFSQKDDIKGINCAIK